MALVVATLMVVSSPGGGSRAAEPADGGSAPATVGVQGLVDTLAGPGWCRQTATPVAGSRTPRALAIGSDGRLQVETGPPAEPVIATVTSEGQVTTRDSRIGPPTEIAGAPDAVADTPAVAGRMVADADGAVIIAAGTRIERLTSEGVPATVAGDPTGELAGVSPSRSGDAGPAGQARFRSATSLARDTGGNLFVADHGGPALASPTVRFVNRGDEPITFYDDTADEITVEAGHIATIAGTPTPDDDPDDSEGGDGDGGASRVVQARLHGNATLAVDGDALYIASAHQKNDAQARVAMINLGGEPFSRHGETVEPGGLAVVAGGDDTTIAAAGGIAAADGEVVIADPAGHRVHRLDREGFVGTLAGAEGLGANVGGFDGNRQPAVGARLNHPVDVAIGGDGQVYVTDRDNGQVRVVEGETIRATVGNGIGLTWKCENGQAGRGPRAGGPASAAVDDDGATYVALADAHQVVRRTPSGQVTTVAGTGEAGFAGDGGPADTAQLATPTAVALGPDDDRLYVYDGGNARLRLVNLTDTPISAHGVTIAGGTIATVAGTSTPPTSDRTGDDAGDEGGRAPARETAVGAVATPSLVELGGEAAAGFSRRIPHTTLGDLAVDAQGSVVVAEPRQHPDAGAYQPDEHPEVDPVAGRVRRLTSDGDLAPVAAADAASGGCCVDPAAVAVAGDRLYVADAATRQVWLVNRTDQPLSAHGHTVDGGDAKPVAGTGDRGFTAQASLATDADLLSPSGLALSADGAVYLAHVGIAEGGPPGHYLHRLDGDGTIAVTAGTGQAGYNGDTRPPRVTAINLPTDLAVDPCGNVAVADAGNDRIRRLNLAGPCTANADPAGPTSEEPAGGLPLVAVAAFAGGGLALAAAGWYWRRRPRQ